MSIQVKLTQGRRNKVQVEYRAMLPDGYPLKTVDGKYTFYGTIVQFFNQADSNTGSYISKGWNEPATYEKNLKIILGTLIIGNFTENQKYKALEDFLEEDYSDIVECVREEENYPEESDTWGRLRALFWKVYKVGLDNLGFEQKIFWSTDISLLESRGNLSNLSKGEAKKLLIPRSLSVTEEMRLINRFKSLDPLQTRGQELGLYLMFFLGLRNNEVCGLNFSDITNSVYTDESRYAAVVTRSSEYNSRNVKPGGKTKNAVRIVPVVSFLQEFIEKRKVEISNLLESGILTLPEGARNVGNLPIACLGNDYCTRCASSDLSKESSAFFKNEDTKRRITTLSGILSYVGDLGIEEKDPTTYLLRRNFATHLYGIGLEASEIQYIIGHEIEAVELSRSYLSNQDSLNKMHEAFDKHQFYALYDMESFRKKTVKQISVPNIKAKETIHVRFVCKEPCDTAVIGIDTNDISNCKAVLSSTPIDRYPESVDITSSFCKD